MRCKNCGQEIPDDSLFCFNCGTKVEKDTVNEQILNENVINVMNNVQEPIVQNSELTRGTDEQIDPNASKLEQSIENLSNIAEEKASIVDEKVQYVIKEADKREQLEMQFGSAANTVKGNASIDESSADSALLIFSAIFGVFFAGRALMNLWNMLRGLFYFVTNLGYYFGYNLLGGIFNFISVIVGGTLRTLPSILLALLFFVFAFRRKKTQTSELLFAILLAAVAAVPVHLINRLIFRYYIGKSILFDTGIGLLGCLLLFAILLAAGYKTLLAMDYSTALPDSFNAVVEAITGEVKDREAKSIEKAQKQAAGSYNGSAINAGTYNSAPMGMYNPAPVAGAPMYNAGYMNGQPTVGTRMIKTDRGIFKYFIFTILTCGIYSFFFIHSLAKDVNEMCKDDNDKVGGLVAYILLSIVTCGLYSIYWEYKIANRLQANASRYNLVITENGNSVLLWTLVGIFLCGIGPFIAMNIVIKNTNRLAQAYNNVVMQNMQ